PGTVLAPPIVQSSPHAYRARSWTACHGGECSGSLANSLRLHQSMLPANDARYANPHALCNPPELRPPSPWPASDSPWLPSTLTAESDPSPAPKRTPSHHPCCKG